MQVRDPGCIVFKKLGPIPSGIRFFAHGAPLKFARHLLRAVDVLLLARFIAAAQQKHDGLVPDRLIDPIALGHVDPQLADPLAHAPVVAEITVCNPVQAHRNPRLGLAVPQGSQPAAEGLAHDDRVWRLESASN